MDPKNKSEEIHKDFHGLLSYALIYLEENYGPEVVKDYLVQVANHVYAGLS